MNVIINSPRGILIPEIPVTVSLDKKTVTFGSIDKLKYNKFLELGFICVSIFHNGDFRTEFYFGDEITHSELEITIDFYGICIQYETI